MCQKGEGGFMKVLSFLNNNEITKNQVQIVIRHSIKEAPPENQPYHDVPLTIKGLNLARTFSEEIKELDLKSIFTSPLRRCNETAEGILTGYGKDLPTIYSTTLGDPGPYVEDEELAGETFLKNYPEDVVKMHVNGHKLPGFRDISQDSKMLMELLLKKSAPSIFITHDVIIASLLGFLNGRYPDINNWIGYMDGFIFCPYSKDFTIIAEGFIFSKSTIEERTGCKVK